MSKFKVGDVLINPLLPQSTSRCNKGVVTRVDEVNKKYTIKDTSGYGYDYNWVYIDLTYERDELATVRLLMKKYGMDEI